MSAPVVVRVNALSPSYQSLLGYVGEVMSQLISKCNRVYSHRFVD